MVNWRRRHGWRSTPAPRGRTSFAAPEPFWSARPRRWARARPPWSNWRASSSTPTNFCTWIEAEMKPYTRRELLIQSGRGFGALALASMLEAGPTNPLAPKPPHFPPRAKAVIHLFMHGGVSHVDTFDPKPELAKRSGQTISAEMAKGLKTNRIDFAKAPMRGSPWKFARHGQSGMEISELYPGIASKADEIALIRSCHGDAFDHAP